MRWHRPNQFRLIGQEASFRRDLSAYREVRRAIFDALPGTIPFRLRVRYAADAAADERSIYRKIHGSDLHEHLRVLIMERKKQQRRLVKYFDAFSESAQVDVDFHDKFARRLNEAGIEGVLACQVLQIMESVVDEFRTPWEPSPGRKGRKQTSYGRYDNEMIPVLRRLGLRQAETAALLVELQLIRGLARVSCNPGQKELQMLKERTKQRVHRMYRSVR